ncbi:hypothetical protein ACE2AJ_14185 [Aquihabitans daechungensis]|uniref:hypothetical protein n=1 Tax=Aquihabitans daechungensis TaxID=1052257 RepID=UPI003BA1D5A4
MTVPPAVDRWTPTALLAAPVVAATAWVVVAAAENDTKFSSDGTSQVETAQRLIDGLGFGPTLVNSVEHAPFSTAHFPPGLSVVLALLMSLGLSALASALVINLVSWVATFAACTALYRSTWGKPGVWFYGLLGWLAVCGSVVALHQTVMSEPLYLALSLWFLVLGERWLTGGSWRLGAITVVLGAAAISVRYVGICLIAAAAVRVLQQGGTLRRIAARLAAVGAMLVPIVVWYLVNHDSGRKDAPGSTVEAVKFADVIHSIGSLGSIFSGGIAYSLDDDILGPLDPVVRGVVLLAGLAAFAVAAILAVRWWRLQGSTSAQRLRRARSSRYLLVLDYLVLSTAFLIVYRIPSGYSILSRYWAMLVVPAAVLLAARASRSSGRWPQRSSLLSAGIVLFLGLNALLAVYFHV